MRPLLALLASVALAISGALWLSPAASATSTHRSSTSVASRSTKPVTPTAKTTPAAKTALAKTVSSSLVRAAKKPITAVKRAKTGRTARANDMTPQGGAVPNAPVNPSATAGNQSAVVTFTPPGYPGTSPITYFTATSDPGGITVNCYVQFYPCDSLGIAVTGLTNGTPYTFTVTATNSVGTSAGAISNQVTPTGPPAAPRHLSSHAGDMSATISFNPVPTADDGGAAITSYTVTSIPATTPVTCNETGVTLCENGILVSGLTNGTAYTFTATATNSAGTSAASDPSNSTVPGLIPDAPPTVYAVAGNQSATLSITYPNSDGESPVNLYTVTSTPSSGSTYCTEVLMPVTTCVVNGLTNGTRYTFSVTATNDPGTSTSATTSNQVTPAPTAPGAPTGLSAVAGNQSATVSFSAPTDDGGAPIEHYTVTSNPGGKTATCDASPCTVSGLTNGTAYTFSVTATNSAGTSTASAASGSVTPEPIAPDAPTAVSAASGDQLATVSFTPPTSDGGAAITSYTATSNPGGLTGTCTASPCTVTGLTNGTPYTFTVTATNSAGTSVASAASMPATPGVPMAPVAPTATASATSITVSFAAPDDGGAPITGYEYSLDGGITWSPLPTSDSRSAVTGTISGLDPATQYSVQVRADNVNGSSAASAPVALYTLPAALSAPTVTSGISSVTVSWTPSTASTVTGYTVYAHPGSATCTVPASASSCVLGATAGVSYTYTVVANTVDGSSAPSTSSVTVAALSPTVPSSAPTTAPTTLTTTKGKLSTVTAGETMTLVGTGYLPFSSITLLIYSSPTVLGTTVTDAQGDFSKTVTLPSDLAAGEHNIVASGAGPDGTARFIRMPVTVAATATTSTTSSKTGSSSLAYTGTPAAQLALGGIACIVLGGITLTTTRRRRSRA